MAYERQNFEDGQVLKAEHINKIEAELAREKSWDDIGIVHGDTLTFDGNTDGVVRAGEFLIKVSDVVPTPDDFQFGCAIEINGQRGEITAEEFAEGCVHTEGGAYGLLPALSFVPPEAVGSEIPDMGGTFPEAGTYFVYAPEMGMWITELQIFGYTSFVSKSRLPKERSPVKTKLYFKQDGDEFVYTDVLCTTMATTADIPDELDFILGSVSEGAPIAQYWVHPILCFSKVFANEVHGCQIQYLAPDGTPRTLNSAEMAEDLTEPTQSGS